MKCLLTTIVSLGAAAWLILSGPLAAPALAESQPTRLMLHDMHGDTQPIPETLRDRRAWLEEHVDFVDGFFVRLPESSLAVLTDEPLAEQTVAEDAAPMKPFIEGRFRHNLAMIWATRPPDPFDDWSTVIDNWVAFARAIREAGFAGIAFDNEEYYGGWTHYPDDVEYPEKSLSAYREQVRLRGREVMKAVTAEFPDIRVLFFHGPSVSEPAAPEDDLFPAWQHAHQLKGPFFAGFVEGAGEAAQVVDGGELYALRTAEEFAAAYAFQKNGIASDETDSAFIPAELRPRWAERVSVAYGIYNQPWAGREMDARTYAEAALNALRTADDYVWLYPEQTTFLEPDGIPSEWREQLRRIRADYLAEFEDD